MGFDEYEVDWVELLCVFRGWRMFVLKFPGGVSGRLEVLLVMSFFEMKVLLKV